MKNAAFLFSVGMTLCSASHAFELISADEAAQNARMPEGYAVRRAAAAEPPRILVERPASRDLKNPIDIDIRFIPEAGTQVDPDSLKILYGWMGIDITDRIRPKATITARGIVANGAELPAGSHTLTIEVTDSKRRVGRAELNFSIH